MKKVLITGATGNVGLEVIKALTDIDHSMKVYAGVRNPETDQFKLAEYPVQILEFDFENPDTYRSAFEDCDILFLLRPPQISDVKKYFQPLIESCIKARIKHIVFLSVQGVEKSKIIPHHKIEKLIVESKIAYTFLRPAYFMQNFTTTLKNDLIKNHRIYLPAGKAKFTLIDVEDVGKVAAKILINPKPYMYTGFELTNNECLTFYEMADKLSQGLHKTIRFESPNLIRFYLTKRKEGIPRPLILVMIMLHYFPRFQKAPQTSSWVKIIMGQEPKTFDEFVNEYKIILRGTDQKIGSKHSNL